jgi:hypothetical protein
MLAVGAYDTCLFFNTEKLEESISEIYRELIAQGRNFNQMAYQINLTQIAHPENAELLTTLFTDLAAGEAARIKALEQIEKLMPTIVYLGNQVEKRRRYLNAHDKDNR